MHTTSVCELDEHVVFVILLELLLPGDRYRLPLGLLQNGKDVGTLNRHI